jgi:endo-1,3(4)-beta-glucanase
MSQSKLLVCIVGGIVLGAALTAVYLMVRSSPVSGPPAQVDVSILDAATLDKLPKRAESTANLSRLSADILPPTNSWISGMVLQDKPMAVYPMPLSFQAVDTGFTIGLPTISSTETVISGGHSPAIDAEIKDARSFSLTRFDKTSATITYRGDTSDLGRLTITQGSP